MITLELVTLGGVKFAEDVYEVILPTELGQIAVFPHHMPLVSLVVPGLISIRRKQSDPDSKMEHFSVYGGVIQIEEDRRLRVLVDTADSSDEVAEKEVQDALKHAKQLAKDAKDDSSLEEAMSKISYHQSQLKVAELKNRHRTHKKITK